ncbi:hypothetical protein ABZP36_009893 [Zizania latifolia]
MAEKGKLSSEDVKMISRFEKMTRDAANVQRETLRRILDENAGVEYLRELGLGGCTDPDSFRARVPLTTHADIEPYVQRIADGDTSPVLTAKPVTAISLSSGTTQGKRKYLLFNDEHLKSATQGFLTTCAFRNRAFPVEDGKKALQFLYSSGVETTKGGLTATTLTTNLFRSKEYRTTTTTRDTRLKSSSPREVLFSLDFEEALYCHLLCGLLFADEVQLVSAAFAHSLVIALQTLERLWPELCADIRNGTPSTAHVTTPAVRRAVSALLAAADPALADAVEARCAGLSGISWHGVIPALWPNAKYVHAIMTGSMEHYVKKLRHYAGDGLPLAAGSYISSEGIIGINVDHELPPESVTFTVLPDAAYFEFIPLNLGCAAADTAGSCYDNEAEPVALTDVVVGQQYEVVMTTFTGLYRYRLGDVVKVAGFHHSAPKLKFVCRRSLVLSINIDKNSEQDLQLAVDRAAKILAGAGGTTATPKQLEVADYTSHADMPSDPGHYVLYWELNGGGGDSDDYDDDVLQRCCDELDRAFAVDAGYVSSRKTRAIGPLELRVLQRGTFREVLRRGVAGGTPVSQFKLPRCIPQSNTDVLQLLSGNTVKVFFSTAYD